MPSPLQVTQTSASSSNAVESSYRSETSYKKFSTFLNRELTIQGKQAHHRVQFSVLELLKNLNIQQAVLKGSAVHHWDQADPLADIDLQLPQPVGSDPDTLLNSLLGFIQSKNVSQPTAGRTLPAKTWFRKVCHDMDGHWTRSLISIGYPQAGTTTLDLNFTQQNRVAYDTLNASKAIQFNWIDRKAALIDSWHPHIVQWMRTSGLLWFNPDIQNGLGRLSYRLSKDPTLHLLQPGLAQHFCEQAEPDTLANVYLRVLRREYRNTLLSRQNQAALWRPVIDGVVEQQADNPQLLADLLAWSKYGSVNALLEALDCESRQDLLFDALAKALQVSNNFKTGIAAQLQGKPEFKVQLSAVIDKALGAELVPGQRLFQLLDQWPVIQELPEHELQLLLGPCLEHLANSGSEAIQTRARNVQGWIENKEIKSLRFWIDRIPHTRRSSPGEKATLPLCESAVQLIRSNGPAGLGEALPDLCTILLGGNEWLRLCEALFEHGKRNQIEASMPHPENPSESLVVELMNLVSRHAKVLVTMLPGATMTLDDDNESVLMSGLHGDLIEFASRVKAQRIPPLLKNALSTKGGELKLQLPQMVAHIGTGKDVITFSVERVKHLITAHMYASIRPNTEEPGVYDHSVIWEDGTFMTGNAPENHAMLKGQLSKLLPGPLPPGLQGLLNIGRGLCTSLWPSIQFNEHQVFAMGVFNSQGILKSKNLLGAMMALKNGLICDQEQGQSLKIQHEIVDGKPSRCVIHTEHLAESPDFTLHYTQATETTPANEFSNAWGCQPASEHSVEFDQLQITPSLGRSRVQTFLHWNPDKKAFEDWCEVKGTGPAPFEWNGRVQADGKLLPMGSLYLAGHATPAIVFDADHGSMNIPLSLLPIVADMLGRRLNGSYPFQPRVWTDKNSWPPAGFEGFVSHHKAGSHWFSGYITSTGQAMGILNSSERQDRFDYTSRCGAFQIQNAPHKYQGYQQEPSALSKVSVPLSGNRFLVPHGLIRQQRIGKSDHEVHHVSDWMFFDGAGLPMERAPQGIHQVYEAPGTAQYWVGRGFISAEGNPLMLDVVLNPGDGGPDYEFIRAANYHTLEKHNDIYRDAQGMSAIWTSKNNHLVFGSVQFPCGLGYQGELTIHNNFISFNGRGKLTFNGAELTGVFNASTGHVSQIKGRNETGNHWIQLHRTLTGSPSVALADLMDAALGEEDSVQRLLRPHLLVRNLAPLKSRARLFAAFGPPSP